MSSLKSIVSNIEKENILEEKKRRQLRTNPQSVSFRVKYPVVQKDCSNEELQKRLAQTMPRYPEPNKPIPRYITGKLAQSFQIMANYRTGTMGFYNTPPAAGYVDELNQNGWMLDKTLVEPTIRQITQQLFGRQFRVLRTQ